MRNNLIPTPVTDKNGKLTTVHRRNGAATSKVSSLAGIKPSLTNPQASASKSHSDDKIVKVKWKISEGSMPMSDGSFLDRAGLKDKVKESEVKTQGHPMTRGEVFEFMKLGISFYEAAALHQIGGALDQWADNPDFNNALPKMVKKGTKAPVSLNDTMDLLKREGTSLSKVYKLVGNGLTDEILQRSVLEPNEIISLFTRFTYTPSVNPDVTTNSVATMEALNEGLLPSNLISNMNADRSIMTSVLYALYPPTSRKDVAAPLPSDAVSESVRQELINDHEKLTQVIEVMSKFSSSHNTVRLESIDDTVASIDAFGAEACLKDHPNLLNYTMSNGKPVGPARLKKAKAIVNDLDPDWGNRDKQSDVYPGPMSVRVYKGRDEMELRYTDIAEFHLMGMSNQEIIEKTVGADMGSNRALAIAQERVSPAVSSGWL